ncbi:MAG: TadE family type IV pilus minor pilin [Candidatus Nanopelagicales bacterium]
MKNKLRQVKVSFLKFLTCRNFISEKGLVTAESAIAMMSLMTVLGMCLSVLFLVFNQFLLFESARQGSRMLSRGENESVVKSKMLAMTPSSNIDFVYENDLVTVLVQKEFVNIFKILKVNLSADSTSVLESYE